MGTKPMDFEAFRSLGWGNTAGREVIVDHFCGGKHRGRYCGSHTAWGPDGPFEVMVVRAEDGGQPLELSVAGIAGIEFA